MTGQLTDVKKAESRLSASKNPRPLFKAPRIFVYMSCRFWTTPPDFREKRREAVKLPFGDLCHVHLTLRRSSARHRRAIHFLGQSALDSSSLLPLVEILETEKLALSMLELAKPKTFAEADHALRQCCRSRSSGFAVSSAAASIYTLANFLLAPKTFWFRIPLSLDQTIEPSIVTRSRVELLCFFLRN